MRRALLEGGEIPTQVVRGTASVECQDDEAGVHLAVIVLTSKSSTRDTRPQQRIECGQSCDTRTVDSVEAKTQELDRKGEASGELMRASWETTDIPSESWPHSSFLCELGVISYCGQFGERIEV
ncbi:unnamed protein product [Taenia asiatica]|uniref:Uncharacterized protein n=1 Tax=Taenia asiatica TaxID=60517 RepID=A0A0R3WBM5_TAEAS|nr:unnamed protein product [Taenia asiatica]